ncbi:MAG: energy-dependent translational throttle protein EttA [Candidatus Hydrogenedentes bacterium]|nr:energy-dependent translational throttle protein EttA [Candidatus Hydrogenedentota bacterium]
MSPETVGKAILSVQNVVKGFGAQPVLEDISMTIHEGDRIGLIGINGSGKSTLMKILAGAELPDAGLVTYAQGLRVGLLDQHCRLDFSHTVGQVLERACQELRALLTEYHALTAQLAEEMPDGKRQQLDARHAHLQHELEIAGAWDLGHEVKRVSVALDLPAPDRLVGTLSGGELRRVDLAAKLVQRPDVLLLDEPTNQIDTRSVEWIEDFLEHYAGSCVLVTHDRYFLDRVVNRIVELAGYRMFSFPGRYQRFLEAKSAVLAVERRAEGNRQSMLRRELEWLRRGPKARSTKQKARIQRYDALEQQDAPIVPKEIEFAIPEPRLLGKRILEADQIARSHGGKVLFRRLSLIMQKGMRIGVVGPNGCGKTTLLRTLMGVDEPDEGKIAIGDATEFLYIDQNRAELDPDMSILKFVSNGVLHWDVGERRIYVPAYLEGLLFDRETIRMPMKNLSGGERNRIDFARQLLRGGNFLVLDEPTNDLDLATLRVLEEAILAFKGCALIVSHDRYFLNRVCTHLLAFEPGGNVVHITGNYDDYLLYRERREEAQSKLDRAAPKPVRRTESREPSTALTWKEKKDIEGIEQAIQNAEKRVTGLEQALLEPGFYEQGYVEVQRVLKELEEAKAAVETLYARWQELEHRRAEHEAARRPN